MNLIDNKDAIKNYEDTFNLLNRNRNSVKQDPNGDLYSFSHGDINTCDLDGTGVCIQTYMIDVDQ